jgi:hypothetical protein
MDSFVFVVIRYYVCGLYVTGVHNLVCFIMHVQPNILMAFIYVISELPGIV